MQPTFKNAAPGPWLVESLDTEPGTRRPAVYGLKESERVYPTGKATLSGVAAVITY